MISIKLAWSVQIAVVIVITLYPCTISVAQQNQDILQSNEIITPFGDPSHATYFNYQHYLSGRKLPCETKTTWKNLSASERRQRIITGEAFLATLHTELAAKQKLTPDEEELILIVWEKGGIAQGNAGSNKTTVATAKQADITGIVNTVSKKIGNIQGTKNWDNLFDGSRDSTKNIGAVAMSASMRQNTPRSHLVQYVSVRKHSAFQTPPINEERQRSDHGAWPVAAGLMLLTGGYIIAKGALVKQETGAASDGELLPALANRGFSLGMRNIQPETSPHLKVVQLASSTCSDGSCSGGCAGGCQDSCSFGCTSGCSGCSGGCSGKCQGGCTSCSGCTGSCSGCSSCTGCSGTCSGTVSG